MHDLLLIQSVYLNHGEILLSGVGCYGNPGYGIWIAPPLPHMRWDDHGYTGPCRDRIPVMKQFPEDRNRHGYVVHDACWRLLQKVVGLNDIPLERLYRICRSLPFPTRGIGVSWGHDYGGLSIIDNKNYYPWEDRLVEQDDKSEVYAYARYNPYDVPELHELLLMSSQEDRNSNFRMNIFLTNANNCFSLLPWEIREFIASYLSARDIANLFMSTKAFLPLLTSQTFWSSRFNIGSDRDFVFEARSKRLKDWLYLYQMTNDAQSPPSLKNRKRVWSLIKPLANLLCFQLARYTDYCHADLNPDPRWTVTADIHEDTVPNCLFEEGCRLFEKQSTFLPKDLVKIAFPVTEKGVAGYLTGIRFTSKDGSHIRLGYIAEDKEISLDITILKGFVLAMGSRGIQALQVVNRDRRVSRWFGCPNNSPVTQRLVCSGAVDALEIGIDVMSATIYIINRLLTISGIQNNQSFNSRAGAFFYATEFFIEKNCLVVPCCSPSGLVFKRWILYGGKPTYCWISTAMLDSIWRS